MATKKFFSWSKSRQSTQEPSYQRTGGGGLGGLVSIDALTFDPNAPPAEPVREFNLPHDAKINSVSRQRRPPNLTIVPPNYESTQHAYLGSAAALQNTALSGSSSNLLSFMNDMLRSPAQSANSIARSGSSIHKYLSGRPRSLSLPSTPDLPVELPGSILLENQGFPSNPPSEVSTAPSSRPVSQTIRRDSDPPPLDRDWLPPVDTNWLGRDFYDSFGITQESLRQAKSVQDLGSLTVNMKSIRSVNTFSTSAASPKPSRPQHRKSLSETSVRRRSRPNLSTSSTDSKLTTCSMSSHGDSSNDSTKARVGAAKLLQPSPLIEESPRWNEDNEDLSKHRDELDTSNTPTPTTAHDSTRVDELKATITAQDNTISTLQVQFGSLRSSHEAHVASLVDAHTAEVASLRSYTKALEEQLSQRTLHHASSNNLLFLLDTTEPQTPSRDSSQKSTGSGSANSLKSFRSALEQPNRSPSRESTDMENLKRKLSAARRPEIGNRDTLRELNLYKQNNGALYKQIESLMAKLNESKQNERTLQKKLEDNEKSGTDSQVSTDKVDELEKANQALQNTVDHLEHRLELANVDMLDAKEQLYIVQSKKSPFDPKSSEVDLSATATGTEKDRKQQSHLSMSTVFSSESPIHQDDSQEPTTLAAFIARIERLQEEIKEKDARIEELETENDGLQLARAQVELEKKELSLHSDNQTQLLKASKQNEAHIDQLRSAIIDREAIIGEKKKAIRIVERQLDHHKLLLEAEIRKRATMSVISEPEADYLSDLYSLASKSDIDRWIEQLRARLRKEKAQRERKGTTPRKEDMMAELRQEIDFYIQEIIYYKLDIRGYKSDIKRLKHASRSSRMSDMESIKSNTPSLAPSGDEAIKARFPSEASGLGISNSPSPVSTGPISAAVSIGRPITPPPTALMTPEPSPKKGMAKMVTMSTKRVPQQLNLKAPITPQTPKTPPCQPGINIANEVDNIDPGISPRSVARLSPERRKPTPPSPDQEKFGELATNFPLSTPASPKKHPTQRSLSESIIKLCSPTRTPEWSPASRKDGIPGIGGKAQFRARSASVPDETKVKTTPERPPRPQYGLFDSPMATGSTARTKLPSPPRIDVLAEAMRNSPDQTKAIPRITLDRGYSNSSAPAIPAPTSAHIRSSVASSGLSTPTPFGLRSRAGSAGSSTANAQPWVASPERKLSSSSSSNTPFVIGMGSPHNPALIQPVTTIAPTACSITAKSEPLKVTSPTSKAGLCGTMASSSPTPSPTQATKPPNSFFGNSGIPSPAQSPLQSTIPAITRSISSATSFTRKKDSASNESSTPHTPRKPGHSRNVSAPSSFRSAMQLPGSLTGSLIKGKGRVRKESASAGAGLSISHPKPLASPFTMGIERSAKRDAIESGTKDGGGIGQAM